ncbi:P-loop containing nucleoside triphosphate hydrolase protein [Neocallimastix lanati (nom. inval.)]|nr:P-loop containing nucleoside triphosphate hydrolase protein [Neocallimastix sp. JGI-2020a]
MKQISTSMDNIHVAIRIRPLLQENDTSVWTCKGNVIYPTESKVLTSSSYCVDKIFDVDSNTEEVYNSFIRHIIYSTMDGFNGTVFAYGQTSSGKTHTMHGDRNDPGIIPRAIHDIFQIIQNTPDREYLLRVSYLEIYNEKIKDLLNPSHENLKIHMKNNEFYVEDLTEDIVLNPEEVANLLKKGDDFRHIGQTNMNEHSSRSHTIFRMIIESREKSNNNEANNNSAIKVSHLNLVDLAGSERVSQLGGDAQQVKEGVHINLSLFTLGVVIAKLSEGNDNTHIPYRDSKLTRILQPSLGGNARTAIICTITPSSDYQEESHSTLKFAIRAKTIQNKPEVNEIVSDEALLKKYRKEINSLKKQLQEIQTQDRLTELSKIKEHNIAMMKKLEEKEQHEV